ncbi:hypothetical protein S2M10_16870 [Sphingomonas sp. S2M10]|uniref:helix-turn-helix domain-containing protein n=2 Tax=Sphingomonadaceae TaxID=41297 RepID=UPI0016A32C21|nr:helix-turn-helix transcriptional regulator [Sphingomonas paucimobilis]MDG5973347.1 helix-turn-helix transcriptional regulator [Sphingomonas paucimobilis]NLS26702.1 hypothetical protein [Sphingomonas sp. S2M10]
MQPKDPLPFANLTDRHRELLRLVYQHLKTAQIAHRLNLSPGHVNNQLTEANKILGVGSRREAATLLAMHEAGVQKVHSELFAPSIEAVWPLPLPLPTSKAPMNALIWKQVVAWGGIIAIALPIAVTVAAMAIITVTQLLGMRAT